MSEENPNGSHSRVHAGTWGGLTKLGRAFGAVRIHASAWCTPLAPLRRAEIARASLLRDRAGGAPR